MTDDGDTTREISALVGFALLHGLSLIDADGDLVPDSKYLDLGIVITTFLDWAKDKDHEDYGIEDEAVAWRPDVVAYYEKSGLGFDRGIFGIEQLLEKLKDDDSKLKKKATADPWGYKCKFQAYKKGRNMGGEQYNILKMSRKERASHAFDKKDPLAEFSLKDIKEGNLLVQ